MNIPINIQEGTYTVSVYLPPKAVESILGTLENSHDGLTFVFEMDTLNLIEIFHRDGQYTNDQLGTLQVESVKLLERSNEGRTGNGS